MGAVPFVSVTEEKKAEPYYSSEALDLYFYSDGEHTMPISNDDETELFETVFYKEIYLLFSAQLQFPDRGNDVYLRGKNLKYNIKCQNIARLRTWLYFGKDYRVDFIGYCKSYKDNGYTK